MSDKPGWMRMLDAVSSKTDLFNDKVASIRTVDDMVGSIVEALQQTGKLDQSLQVVTSDNGYQYGTHRRPSKYNLYEESIRVPLVIRAPDQREPQVTDEWALNNDLTPTFLDYGAAIATRPVDGRSLRPILRGGVASSRRSMMLEAPLDDTAKTVDLPFSGIRTRDPELTGDPHGKKVLVYAETFDALTGAVTDTEFYDLDTDPYQIQSLHRSRGAGRRHQMAALKARLAELQRCSDASCRRLEN